MVLPHGVNQALILVLLVDCGAEHHVHLPALSGLDSLAGDRVLGVVLFPSFAEGTIGAALAEETIGAALAEETIGAALADPALGHNAEPG